MQIGDLIKPKMHLEALREPHREDHGLLEVHTRWEDPKKEFKILCKTNRTKFFLKDFINWWSSINPWFIRANQFKTKYRFSCFKSF